MNEIKNISFQRKLYFPETEGKFIFWVICFCNFLWHLWFVESVDDTTPSSCFMSMTSHEWSVKMLSWLVFRYCPAFQLDELRKIMRSSVADSRIWVEGLFMKMEQAYRAVMILTFTGWLVLIQNYPGSVIVLILQFHIRRITTSNAVFILCLIYILS
jgi:hypothetical protein